MPLIRSFSDLRARSFLVEQIMRPVKAGRIVHAQLFTGPKGTGKMSAALLTARAMNCEGAGEKPCNVCPSCLQFLSGNSPRLMTIAPEKNTIRVEQIRAMIDQIYIRPDSGRVCVIIDDAHLMNESAQNALLKTLEETPEYAAFFLITDKPSSLLPTIRSRCAVMRFAPLSDAEVEEALVSMGTDRVCARDAAENAGGSIGRALQQAEDDGYKALKKRALDALAAVRKPSDAASAYMKIEKDKDASRRILEIYENAAQALLRAQSGMETLSDEALIRMDKNGVRGEELLKAVIECAQKLKANVAYQSSMEMLFFDIASQEEIR